jgi:hypothetical protein
MKETGSKYKQIHIRRGQLSLKTRIKYTLKQVIVTRPYLTSKRLKPTEASKAVRNIVDKGANQVSVRKYKHDGNAQMINNIPVIVNGIETSYKNKVQICDMTHSGDSVKTCETDTNNKQEFSKKKATVSATDTSKNKGNHTLLTKQKILIIGDSHVRHTDSTHIQH